MKNSKNGRSRSAILKKLSSNAQKLRQFGVKRIGLFGSAATGHAGTKSDIDLLVEFKPGRETFTDLMGLYTFLKGLFGDRIDLVTMDGLSPYLAPHILQEVKYIEGPQ